MRSSRFISGIMNAQPPTRRSQAGPLTSCCWRPIHVTRWDVQVLLAFPVLRAKPVAGEREGRSWSAWLWPGDERLNFDDGIRFAVQGPAVQEPQ